MSFASEATRTAEQSVIGAVLLDEKSLGEIIDIIKPEDFYFLDLKSSYEAILSLSSKGKSIDFVTVLNELSKDGKRDQNATKAMLIQCADITPSIRNAARYAKIVADCHKARILQNIGARLTFDGVSAENADETANEVMGELFELAKKRNGKKVRPISEVGENLLDDYLREKSSENRCDTGFSKLDGVLKGMSAGNLIILAARPKVGKTAFALQIAENAAKAGKTVAFYSLEMEAGEIYERLLSKSSGIPMNTLIDRRFNNKRRPEKIRNDELILIEKTVRKIKELPIKINDNPGLTVSDIRLECRMIQNLGLIVIDYLQLMRSAKKSENRNQEVGEICRNLKCLAGELGVPILCLSQLNRNSDESQRPTPNELRDSGEIEQSANKLIMLWCVEKILNERGFVESKIIGADVALNRRGTTGVTIFNFNGNYMRFTELDRVYEEPKNAKIWRKGG